MAVTININQLTQEQIKYISSHLKIIPKPNFFDIKRSRKFGNDAESNIPIDFYLYDETTGNIKIPYKYSCVLFGCNLNKNIRHPIIDIKFTKQLFESQIDIYESALKSLTDTCFVNLNIYTGAGKTILASKLVSMLSRVTLVLVTNTILCPQWYKTMINYTTSKPYIVDGILTCDPYTNVLICMTSRIHYIPQEWLNLVGTLVIDESHTFCSASRVQALLSTTPLYCITCSATPIRDDGMHVMMECLSGIDRIIRISKKPFNVTRYNTGYNPEIPLTRDGMTNWSELVNMMCGDEERNNIILDLIKKYANTDKILVLTTRQEHVYQLHKMILALGIKCDYMTGIKKSYSDSTVLVASIKKVGTGFDEESACEDFNGIRINRLILPVSIKSVSLLEQVAGRVFRSQFPEIDYLIDDNKVSEKHFAKGCTWFKSRNGKIFIVDTPKSIQNKQSVTSDVESLAFKQIQNNQKSINTNVLNQLGYTKM